MIIKNGRIALIGTCLAALLTLPSSVDAQGFLSGSVGGAFGGHTPDNGPKTFGGSAGVLGRAVGVELDVTFTPDFFTSSPLIKDNSVMTVMGNVLVGPRAGVVQPYVVGGLGLMRFHFAAPLGLVEVTRNDIGMNAGGGLIVFLGPAIGLRGDIRYFRDLNDNAAEFGIDFDQFDYWRSTAGLVIRF